VPVQGETDMRVTTYGVGLACLPSSS
jgi:hypothetical protein